LPDPPEKPPDKPNPWTPEMVKAIIDSLRPLGERFIGLQERRFEHELALEKTTSRASWYVLLILMVFLTVVIAAMVLLVLNNKVSGDALLFLVGTVSGYILAIVQRHLFPEIIQAPPES
jgi:hypothetical protein